MPKSVKVNNKDKDKDKDKEEKLKKANDRKQRAEEIYDELSTQIELETEELARGDMKELREMIKLCLDSSQDEIDELAAS